MLWIYRQGGDGKIDTQLATSRDGIRWTRVANRATWLELRDEDGWKGGMVRSVERIIQRGDELYIYYCGVHGAHTGPKHKKVLGTHPVQIGLLTQRRDGFVSRHAGKQPGTVQTRPFTLRGATLFLNPECSNDGAIEMEVLDDSGKVLATSRKVTGDGSRHRVEWAQGKMAPLRNRIVSLRFTLRDAHLYSYWVE